MKLWESNWSSGCSSIQKMIEKNTRSCMEMLLICKNFPRFLVVGNVLWKIQHKLKTPLKQVVLLSYFDAFLRESKFWGKFLLHSSFLRLHLSSSNTVSLLILHINPIFLIFLSQAFTGFQIYSCWKGFSISFYQIIRYRKFSLLLSK